MNHKKGRSKRKGSSCKMCKPWKIRGMRGQAESQTQAELKARVTEREQIRDLTAQD